MTDDPRLAGFRRRIDALDDRLVDLLAERFRLIREVGRWKARSGVSAVLEDRIDEVKARVVRRAAGLDLDPALVRGLWDRIVEEACRAEEEIIAGAGDDAGKRRRR